jgi:hypothetical protein
MKIEEMDRILSHQWYPLEASRRLKHIAENVSRDGLSFVLKKAYCLGVIDGKRTERQRHKRI